MSDAGLANLLADCLIVWSVKGKVAAAEGGIAVTAGEVSAIVMRASAESRPVRWLLQTKDRAGAGRPPRAANSITGLLGGLRSALGADAPGPGLAVVEPYSNGPA